MPVIIAGQFDTFVQATAASDALREAAFAPGSIAVFFNNAPGAHDAFPVGGDENADPGARNAHVGAAAGAAVGAAAGLVAAAVAPLAVAAVATTAAYVGALAGGVNGAHEPATPQEPARRPAGVMVAIALPDSAGEAMAVAALRRCGARNIERAEGNVRDGRWIDFDPVSPPHLVVGNPGSASLENRPGG